jgi:hypothetical protein
MDNRTMGLANAIRRMPTKRYLAYMLSQQWARVRTEHLARCDGICELCHSARACQVHHWSYARLGYERQQDLCAVCVRCHHKIHCSIFPVAANDNQLPLPFPVAL